MRKEINTLTRNFNLVRQENSSKLFTRSEMCDLLKQTGLTVNDTVIAKLIRFEIIIKHGITRGVLYSFPKEPVYYIKLQNALAYSKPKSREELLIERLEMLPEALLESICIKILQKKDKFVIKRKKVILEDL